MNSVLYTTNTGSVAVGDGGVYAPSTVVRRYGACADLGSNGIVLKGNGYYDVEVNATVTASAASNIVATLYQDGVAVPGATVTVTAGAIGDEVALPVSAIVRKTKCSCIESVLTLVISGQTVTGLNLSMKAERL